MSSCKSSELVRIAILGCGPRGDQMSKIVSLLTKSFKLCAMSDPDPAARAKVKSRYPDLEVYESSDDLLDKAKIDAVIVETPPAYHAEYVCKALSRNIAVMSEIPVAETCEEAEQLYKAVKSSKALFMTGATANYRQKSRYMLKLKREGILGKAAYVEAEYMHDLRASKDPWRRSYETCRYCCHSLGPLLAVMDGDEFDTVSCMGTGDHFNCGWINNNMAALLRTKNNVVCRFMCGFAINHCGPAHRTVLYTDKGHFKFYNERAMIYTSDMPLYTREKTFYTVEFGNVPERFTNDVEFPYDKVMACGGGGHGGADFIMLEDFADALVNGKPSPVSIEAGLAMTIPGIFAAESAREGGALKKIIYPWSKEK